MCLCNSLIVESFSQHYAKRTGHWSMKSFFKSMWDDGYSIKWSWFAHCHQYVLRTNSEQSCVHNHLWHIISVVELTALCWWQWSSHIHESYFTNQCYTEHMRDIINIMMDIYVVYLWSVISILFTLYLSYFQQPDTYHAHYMCHDCFKPIIFYLWWMFISYLFPDPFHHCFWNIHDS